VSEEAGSEQAPRPGSRSTAIGGGIAVSLRSAGKTYGPRVALADVTVDLPAGAIVGLVGPNGAGKSTLMRLLMGFEPLTSGMVLVLGTPVVPGRAQSSVGYLPQRAAFYRDLTVEDHLALAERYAPHFDRSIARQRLERLDIDPGGRAGALSGGQAAQLGLAIALALRPRIVILDEPLANLDPLARSEFLALVRRDVDERGTTVLISSHSVDDVARMCDRIIVLARGRVVIEGPLDEVRTSHRVTLHAVEEGLVGEIPGGRRWLVRAVPGETGDPASLEDVVLTYLARGRSR